jgi:hypothetical protein
MNDNLVLVCGKSASGKSASLQNIKKPEGVLYLNCENNKKLPFKSKFIQYTITDPDHVPALIRTIENEDTITIANVEYDTSKIHTIVVDSLTYLMDMYESTKVLTSADTMRAWGNYAQFMKQMMSQDVAKSTRNIIFLAHTSDVYNESEMVNETLVKVKGSLMNQGIESFFSTVISCKKMPTSTLKIADSPMYTINEDEEVLGFKYVYQTRLTKQTVNERIRSPLGMWAIKETFIDNSIQHVLERLHEYYDA